MKKNLKPLIISCGIFALLNSSTIFAQVHSNGDISGSYGKPATLPIIESSGNIVKFLGDRFHTLEVENKAYEMIKDGVTERSYVAAFTAKGAILYNHELNNDYIDEKVGKNAGMQILPYTVSMTSDGRTFVSVTGFAMKNMISASSARMDINGDRYNEPFNIIDDIQALIFEYDKNYMVEGVESYKLTFASIDSKLDLLGSSKPGTFLAITGGGDFGLHKTNINTNDDSFTISGVTYKDDKFGKARPTAKDNISGFDASVRYGLEFNSELTKGWNLNARVGAEHNWSKGSTVNIEKMREYDELMVNYDTYAQSVSDWEDRKLIYERQSNGSKVLPTSTYTSLTGDEKPEVPKKPAPEEVNRSLFYMTPSLNLSKRISKPSSRPVRLGIGVYGNIPLSDETRGYKNTDLINSNRELMGAKLFINF